MTTAVAESQPRSHFVRNVVLIVLGIFLLLLALNWQDFKRGFDEGYARSQAKYQSKP